VPRRVIPTVTPPANALDFAAWAESDFVAAFVQLVSQVGEKAAWEMYEKLGKRPGPGRPAGPTDPARDDELRRLVDALNKPTPMPVAENAKLIHGALPKKYGPTPEAIAMRIRRLMGNNI
jgi:hypothetical protein